MLLLSLIFLCLALLMSIALLRWGIHGVRVDDHPLCRSCGFDLTARNPDAVACPECGTNVSDPRGIVIGHRRRRTGMIVSGAGLLLAVIAILSVGGRKIAANFNPNEFKPVWLLMYETQVGRNRDAALVELARRVPRGGLSQERINTLADRAISIQANPPQMWSTAWGDFVERAQRAGKLPEDRWKKYAYYAPSVQLQLRSKVNAGDWLPYLTAGVSARVGSNCPLVLRYSVPQVLVDGIVIQEPSDSGLSGISISSAGGAATGGSIRLPANLAPGKHTLRVSQEYRVYNTWDTSNPPLAVRKIDLDGAFELLPTTQPSVVMRTDPAVRESIQQRVRVAWCLWSQRDPDEIQIQLDVQKMPVGIGFDVWLRWDGKKLRAGSIAARANGTRSTHTLRAILKEQPPPRVDFVLQPSIRAATGTLDVFEIWDGEPILIKDIQIPPKNMRASRPY